MITVSTDFGTGYYVSQMKGVIHSLNPTERVVDFYHHISPQSILEGNFILSQAWKYYPRGSIHLGVVDPGVGSGRKGVIFETDHCLFVGPDNGLFTLALSEQHLIRSLAIDEAKVVSLMHPIIGGKASKTFHGRDIFAPTAALLSMGLSPEQLGVITESYASIDLWENQVLHIDSFGNVIFNNQGDYATGDAVTLSTNAGGFSARVVETFSDAPKGELILLRGSHGFYEVDINQGDAAKTLGVALGDQLQIE